ncbi:MAG: hypothetical protein AAF553_01395 [Pseudomonadota bacterium]
MFRAIAILSAALKNSVDDRIVIAATAATNAIVTASDNAQGDVAFAAADAVIDTTEATVSATDDDAAAYAAYAANAATDAAIVSVAIWETVEEDCQALESGTSLDLVLQAPLLSKATGWFDQSWDRARTWLSASPDGFDIWREWYFGRVQGQPGAFKNFDEAADHEFYTFLIAQNDAWWKRAPGEVNAEIKAKVEELRIIDTVRDPQQSNAPVFKSGEDGRADIDDLVGNDELLKDEPAQQRHAAAKEEIDRLKSNFAQDNNARVFADIAGDIEPYLGSTLDETAPQMLVLETQSLRDALEVQQAFGKNDDFLPLTGEQLRRAKKAINTLNLLIGSDAFLEDIDSKVAGPDEPKSISNSDNLRGLARVTEGEITTPRASQALVKAANHAGSSVDPSDRKVGLMKRIGLNLVRWSITVYLDHEKELTAAIAGGAIVGIATTPLITMSGLSAGAAIAWWLAKNIKSNEDFWRNTARQARVTLENFDRLLEKLYDLPLK